MKTRSNALVRAVIAAAAITLGYSFRVAFAHDVGSTSLLDGGDTGAMHGQTSSMDQGMAPNGMGGRMHMSAHMRMTELRPADPSDIERARGLLDTLRISLRHYRNYRAALAQGMRIFLPTIPQDVYHFVDYPATGQEYQGNFNPRRPGSLLYVKDADGGYTLVGVMYSAPPEATLDELDAIVPLSVARWHVHTNICLPIGISLEDVVQGNICAGRNDVPGMLAAGAAPDALELNSMLGFLADGRFGFEGRIADPAQCAAAGGHLIPQAFGWMVHVYPFSGDDLKVAYGLSVPKVSPTASN